MGLFVSMQKSWITKKILNCYKGIVIDHLYGYTFIIKIKENIRSNMETPYPFKVRRVDPSVPRSFGLYDMQPTTVKPDRYPSEFIK